MRYLCANLANRTHGKEILVIANALAIASRRNFFTYVVAACFLCTAQVHAQTSITYEVVAKTGDSAPGANDDFKSFDPPAINDAGHVIFEASTDTQSSFESGIWVVDDQGALVLLALSGDAAHGLISRTYNTFAKPLIGFDSVASYLGDRDDWLTSACTADTIWRWNGAGNPAVVAAAGQALPGDSGSCGNFYYFTDELTPSGWGNDTHFAMNRGGHAIFYAAFCGVGGCPNDGRHALFLDVAGVGTTTLVKDIDTIGGESIWSSSSGSQNPFSSPVINSMLDIAFSFSSGSAFHGDWGIARKLWSSTIELIAIEGDDAPGTEGMGQQDPFKFSNLQFAVSIAGDGEVAFRGEFYDELEDADRPGIWRSRNVGGQTVLSHVNIWGDSPLNSDFEFVNFGDPVISITHDTVSLAAVVHLDKPTEGQWYAVSGWTPHSQGRSALLAIESDDAPGTGSPPLVFTSRSSMNSPFADPYLNAEDQIAFWATIDEDGDHEGIWMTDACNELHLIVHSGSVLGKLNSAWPFTPAIKKVKFASMNTMIDENWSYEGGSSGNSDGRRSAMSNQDENGDARIAFVATLSNNDEWLIVATMNNGCVEPEELLGAGSIFDSADLDYLLRAWGTSDRRADINGDGIVNAQDLAILIENWE